jgi:hypothetical protein
LLPDFRPLHIAFGDTDSYYRAKIFAQVKRDA